MTDEEKKELAEVVLSMLKSDGIDVTSVDFVSGNSSVEGLICQDKNGNIKRITIDAANEPIKDAAMLYSSLKTALTSTKVSITGTNINGEKDFTLNIPVATTDTAGVMSAEDKKSIDKVPSSVNGAYWKPWANTVDLKLNKNNGTEGTQSLPAATEKTAGVMTSADKKKLNNLAVEGADVDLNTYVLEGTYFFSSKKLTNVPILNDSVVSARLTVLVAYDGTAPVITQVLNLNNLGGGEGNVYIRSNQGNIWKPWGKLQTNIEVGQITPDDMSNLTDNGIYSGVCLDGTDTIETFVLIVINNYLAASQAGFGSYISQLKYAIDLNRGNTVKTRTRDAYGIWSEWSEIGGSTYELPEATVDNLGGVKLGTIGVNAEYAPVTNIAFNGSGIGIYIDTSHFINKPSGRFQIRHNDSLLVTGSTGLSVSLGTYKRSRHIPCVLGTPIALDSSIWESFSVGIPYNEEQFCLKSNGLNLKDDIGSATKVTWTSTSNMNDYTTAGIYDIYGERTNATDNLPITQAYNGASFAARLTVVASTLQPSNTEKCVTQFLQLSNRMGGEGNTYIRTYNENNNGLNGWSEWKKQQGMVESYINTDTVGITATGGQTTGLNGMTENGMYSGIYTDDYTLQTPTFVETFVLVVINDYAVSSQAGTPRRISQLKYATDTLTGQCTVKKRVGTGDDSISWGDWEEIGGGSSEVDITDAVRTYGLPALISQGLAKEGVTYRCSGSFMYPAFLEKLDVNKKIYNKIDSVYGGVNALVEVFVKIIPNIVVVEVYQTGENIGDDYNSYLHYHKFIMDNSCSYVKVSADMTTL